MAKSSARKRRAEPKTPEQILAERVAKLAARRAQDFEAVNLQPEASKLASNDDVEVRFAQRTKSDGARRADAFDALKSGMPPGAYDAARRLEHDMALRCGEGDRGRPIDRVDCDTGRGPMDVKLAAGRRIDAVLAKVGERDAWLLSELIRPSVNRGSWRAVVAHVTGEEHAHGQAAAVRSACANLAAAYRVREAA